MHDSKHGARLYHILKVFIEMASTGEAYYYHPVIARGLGGCRAAGGWRGRGGWCKADVEERDLMAQEA